MGDQQTSPIDYGFRGRLNWIISGAISGVAGAMAFGAVLGLLNPDIVSVTIPSLYGMTPGRSTGWTLHLLHGLVLGVLFGFLVTRELVLRTFILDTETSVLARYGPSVRVTFAGTVYGLLIWISIPLVALPVWVSVAGGASADFPTATVESLFGHLIFGATLGFLFANVINVTAGPE